MYLYSDLLKRASAGNPVRVGLIGAGKFGSMFLSQVPTTPGLTVTVVADLNVSRAKEQCCLVGWSTELLEQTRFIDSGDDLIQSDKVDVVVEATGHPIAGVNHALKCIEYGKHVVMVNVEADVLLGPWLAREARQAGIVYSMAYGDQPALTLEMVDWARSCGFKVIAAGKGTKYLPSYHDSTPDTVWDHYGLTAEQAELAGMRSQMFNSFLDGTKSAIEMSAIANSADLNVPTDGLGFPPCSCDNLAQVLRPKEAGGELEFAGQVEVVSSLHRDGSEVEKDLRWGVYCVFEAPNDYSAHCFRQYGMNTDDSGRYSAMYKPFHLIGLELNMSILAAALLQKPTGSPNTFNADVAAVAKRDVNPGEKLDGEGGFTVWGKLISASDSQSENVLPIGMTADLPVVRPIRKGQIVSLSDIDQTCLPDVVKYRNNLFEFNKSKDKS